MRTRAPRPVDDRPSCAATNPANATPHAPHPHGSPWRRCRAYPHRQSIRRGPHAHPHERPSSRAASPLRSLRGHFRTADTGPVQLAARAVEPSQVVRGPHGHTVQHEDCLRQPTSELLLARHGRRSSKRRIQPRPDHAHQRCSLVQALMPLEHRHTVRGDATPDAEFDQVCADLESTNSDAEFQPPAGARESDRAGVHATGMLFERVDRLHRAELRGSGHRPRRKGGLHQVAVVDVVAQAAQHRRHQVPNPRMRLYHEQLGNPHATGQAHPAEVIAHQVDNHHVLGDVLRRPTKRRGVGVVPAARQGALDRRRADLTAAAAQEQFRAQAHHRPLTAHEQGAVGGV